MLTLRIATESDADVVLDIIVTSFASRPALDPPADALTETIDSVRERIAIQQGLIASVDGEDVGCLFMSYEPDGSAMLHRVSVKPEARSLGVAVTMVTAIASIAADDGYRWLKLVVRTELNDNLQWWSDYGFIVERELSDHELLMCTQLPVEITVPTAEDMHRLGRRVAKLVGAGDVIVVTGELGAGKTTFTQGLGAGLGVAGPITSPTFVLSRVHHASDGPSLVHVDAYRLANAAEIDDIDLDHTLASSVTLIEWGAGLAEQLSDTRLDITIERSSDPDDPTRSVFIRGVGQRWNDVDMAALVEK